MRAKKQAKKVERKGLPTAKALAENAFTAFYGPDASFEKSSPREKKSWMAVVAAVVGGLVLSEEE